ncbi:MAG: NAD(+)/NADH kinase [archaeon]
MVVILDVKTKEKITIGITGRKQNALALETAKLFAEMLGKKKVKVITDRALFGKGKNAKNISSFDCGLVLSFGGDGTLLQVFRDLKKRIPVMEINCGNRGFLSAYQHFEAEQAVEAIVKGNYSIQERTRILAKADGKTCGEALNEALLVPSTPGRILKYSLSIGAETRREAGDGLIVATPTGSTAHSLSAGGPIIRGNAKVFVVVSINPVIIDRSHRPLIINDHEKVSITGFEKIKPTLILDGQKRFRVKNKAELIKGKNVLLAVKNPKKTRE